MVARAAGWEASPKSVDEYQARGRVALPPFEDQVARMGEARVAGSASQEGTPNSCATAWTVLNDAMAATATVARRKDADAPSAGEPQHQHPSNEQVAVRDQPVGVLSESPGSGR